MVALRPAREILKECPIERAVPGGDNMTFNLNDDEIDVIAYRLVMSGHIQMGRWLERKR